MSTNDAARPEISETQQAITAHRIAHERWRCLIAGAGSLASDEPQYAAVEKAEAEARKALAQAMFHLGEALPASVADLGSLAIYLSSIVAIAKQDDGAPGEAGDEADKPFKALVSACALFAGIEAAR